MTALICHVPVEIVCMYIGATALTLKQPVVVDGELLKIATHIVP